MPRLAYPILFVTSIYALAACGGDSRARTPGPEHPQRGGTAIVGFSAEPATVFGLLEKTEAEAWLGSLLHPTLATRRWDERGDRWIGAGESSSALANSWDFPTPDSSTVRFYLRRDARWSDGKRVTAADVTFTLNLLRDTTLGSLKADPTLHFDSATAASDSVVQLHFGRRTPRMMDLAALGIAPEHVFRGLPAAEIKRHPAVREPAKMVTAGPFRVARWERGSRIVLEPNPYSPAPPMLSRLVARILPDATAGAVELQRGDIDLIQVGGQEARNLRNRIPGLSIQSQVGRNYEFVMYNLRRPTAVADRDVRVALGLAIDRTALLTGIGLSGFGSPGTGPWTAMFPQLAGDQQPLPYDPARARNLLHASGWRDADGDGVREKGGQPLRIDIVTNAESQRRADAAVIVQRFWREVGVDARVQRVELNTLYGRLQSGEFQAAMLGWEVPLSPDLAPIFAPGGPANFGGYADAVATREINAAGAAPTLAAAAPHWRAASARIVADQPYTFLYNIDQPFAVSRRLRNVRVDVVSPYAGAAEWWVRNAPRSASAPPQVAAASSRGR